MDNKENIFGLIIVAVLLVLLLSQTDVLPQFSIVTKTTCIDGTISSWEMDGNILDSKGLNNGQLNNVQFITGKFGQAIKFDGSNTSYAVLPISQSNNIVMWVKDYNEGDNSYYFLARDNQGIDYVDAEIDSSKQVIEIGPTFGKNRNISVDRVAIFENLTSQTIESLYSQGVGNPICYTTTEEVNVTCESYVNEQIDDKGNGCLFYEGDFYPNCSIEWKTDEYYKIEDNDCVREMICQDECLSSEGCYENMTLCEEDLEYSCYTITGNSCQYRSDYQNCVENEDSYQSLSECQDNINDTYESTTYSPSPTNDSCLFKIGGYCIELTHLFVILIIVLILAYLLLNDKNGK